MKNFKSFLVEEIEKEWLTVNDEVIWKQKPTDSGEKVKVLDITLQSEGGNSTDGNDVSRVAWKDKNNIVVNLSNGSWAYGEQIYPII